MQARAVEQTKVFEAATFFARSEGILPAPESAHAIRVAIDEALRCKESGEKKTILFCLSGTGYFDMAAYTDFNTGKCMTISLLTKTCKKASTVFPRYESLPRRRNPPAGPRH
jgi:tryptophan synthase beta chain